MDVTVFDRTMYSPHIKESKADGHQDMIAAELSCVVTVWCKAYPSVEEVELSCPAAQERYNVYPSVAVANKYRAIMSTGSRGRRKYLVIRHTVVVDSIHDTVYN